MIRPIQLGKLQLPVNVFYAPLAGCSDFPFRKVASRYRPGLMFCEMVKMDALIRYDPGTFHLLDFSHDMHPIGGQLCGSNPKIAAQAAKIIEDLGFDTIDLNCGCPVDKVTKDGSGSGLLKQPQLIGEIVSNMVAAVSIPVTVKIRAGWDENSLVFQDIVRIAEEAGAKALCLHARTRQQGYTGNAHWNWIKEAKACAKSITIIGNGDLFTPEAAIQMFQETKCDAVLISRGTFGQPWIVQDIMALAENRPLPVRSIAERRQALHEHFEAILSYSSDREAVVDMRRVGCWYIKKSKGTKNFREAISHAHTVEEIRVLIDNFPIEEDE